MTSTGGAAIIRIERDSNMVDVMVDTERTESFFLFDEDEEEPSAAGGQNCSFAENIATGVITTLKEPDSDETPFVDEKPEPARRGRKKKAQSNPTDTDNAAEALVGASVESTAIDEPTLVETSIEELVPQPENTIRFSDVERLLALKARKTLTMAEADELGRLQAMAIEEERQKFALTLQRCASDLATPKFDYDLIYSVAADGNPKLKTNPTFMDCKQGIAEAQNHLGYLTSIYLKYARVYQDWKSIVNTLKSAWKAISLKPSEGARDGEFALIFWDAVTELDKMDSAMSRLKMAMDLAASTRDAFSRQLTAIDQEFRISGVEVFDGTPPNDAPVKQQKASTIDDFDNESFSF